MNEGAIVRRDPHVRMVVDFPYCGLQLDFLLYMAQR